MAKSSDKSKDKRLANLKPFKKGQSGNPKGRAKGQRDYATIYREALIKIGNAKGMTPEEIEEKLEEVGLNKALEGDLGFHKDIKDRIYGKAVNKTELTGTLEVKPITGMKIIKDGD